MRVSALTLQHNQVADGPVSQPRVQNPHSKQQGLEHQWTSEAVSRTNGIISLKLKANCQLASRVGVGAGRAKPKKGGKGKVGDGNKPGRGAPFINR